MTRIAGRPNTPYVKPKAPAPRSSPKSGEAPPPQYHPPTGVAANPTTRTGNNPRGVRIASTPRTPKMLLGGHNPRGVRIAPPRYIVAKIPKYVPPQVSAPSIGGRFAAIAGNPALGSLEHVHIPAILNNLAEDAIHFVPTSIEGLGTIGKAGVQDIVYDATNPEALTNPSSMAPHLKALLSSALKTDPIALAVTGHWSAALHSAEAHPLYAALDFAAGAGMVGRAAGIAGRSGALGETAARAAATARADRVLAPGLPGEARHFSPNILKSGLQHVADHLPQSRHIDERHLNRRTDDVVGVNGPVAHGHQIKVTHEQASAIRDGGRFASKSDKAAADVAPFVTQGVVANSEHMIGELADVRDGLRKVVAKGKDSPEVLKAAEEHATNIDRFLANPDIQAVQRIVHDYAQRQNVEIDPEMVHLGLLTEHQVRMAKLEPYVAAGKMKDVEIRMAAKGDVSFRSAQLKHAWQALSGDRPNLQEAAETIDLVKAETRGAAHMPKTSREKLLAKLNKAEDQLRASRTERDPVKAERLRGEARAALKDAKAVAAKIDKGEERHLAPVVQELGKVKGVRVTRRVSAHEIEGHMLANGVNPDDIAYVNLRAPEAVGAGRAFQGRGLSRSDSPGPSRTAQGVMSGAFTPGHAAFSNSQLGNLAKLDRVKGFDEFARQLAVHTEDGRIVVYSKSKAAQAAADYKAAHGIDMTVVPLRSAARGAVAGKIEKLQSLVGSTDEMLAAASKQDRFGLVPTSQVKRFFHHAEIDSKAVGRASAITTQFRNSVLPFSPKWLAGNVIEATLRAALVGAGPRDAALFAKVIDRMRAEGYTDAADRLESLVGGLHFGMAHEANERLTSAGGLSKAGHVDDARVTAMARATFRAYDEYVVQKVYNFNRKLESKAERAVMGAHMNRQLREFSGTWVKATTSQDEWLKRLADGYTDPRLAADASRFIDETLGRYSRFSPRMKQLVNNIAPFAPWYFNALRFVFVTLPLKHPIAQATLSAAGRVAAQEFKTQGANVPHDSFFGLPVGSLLTAIPIGNDGFVDAARYTPLGAFENGPEDFATSMILPQAMGPAEAIIAGQDPFGSPLRDKNGDITDKGDQMLIGINELAMSLLGPLDIAHRVLAGQGRTEYSGSTFLHTETKPDTNHGLPGALGGLERVLLPFYPTYLAPTTGDAASVGSGTSGYTGVVGTSGYTGAANPSGGYTGALNPSNGYTGGAVVGRAAPPVVGTSGTTVVGR